MWQRQRMRDGDSEIETNGGSWGKKKGKKNLGKNLKHRHKKYSLFLFYHVAAKFSLQMI